MSKPVGSPHPRTFALQPRPRSPSQLISMIGVIVQFDGVDWSLKDNHGKKVNQLRVIDAISQHSDFNISPKSEKEFQGRTYVTMNPPTIGFAYIDKNNILRITDSGKKAARDEDLEVLFTRQMLKWQYPSFVQGGSGGKGAGSFPLKDKWSIHPFVSIIRICVMLEKKLQDSEESYLSKDEIATFVLTMEHDNQVNSITDQIINLRKKCNKLSGREKNELRHKTRCNIVESIYSDDIKVGKYKIRQRPTNSKKEFVEHKSNQLINDFTDTVIRYCRFTGLFIQSDRVKSLKINPYQKWKCIMISSDDTFLLINKNINDGEKYYSWFGNPNLPILPWESKEGYITEIFENLSYAKQNLILMS
jgi:hypothetical protein